MLKINTKNLIVVALSAGVLFAGLGSTKAYADCESNYGGGETCKFNKSFKIVKQVRIANEKESDNEWKSKVTNVSKGDTIEFRITVKNTGDVTADGMKTIDQLPSELQKIGGAGLTEEWDNFGDGTSKTFIITAKVKDNEFDSKVDKCVVNRVQLRQKGNFEGSDTATVCYNNGQPTELPKTGGSAVELTLLGIALIGLAVLIKRGKQLA